MNRRRRARGEYTEFEVGVDFIPVLKEKSLRIDLERQRPPKVSVPTFYVSGLFFSTLYRREHPYLGVREQKQTGFPRHQDRVYY